MLTPSVNVVQSSFPEEQQGEISGLSRSVSNLGSSFGTAIAGTILVSDLASGNTSYVLAMVVLAGFALIGLAAAILLPASREPSAGPPLSRPDPRPPRRDAMKPWRVASGIQPDGHGDLELEVEYAALGRLAHIGPGTDDRGRMEG